MSDMEQYSSYFSAGVKVGIGFPLPNAEVFRDWAIIHAIDEDLVSLQLSRDVLPVSVTLRYGQVLELRGGSEGNSYSCRAIIVSEGNDGELLLRLIGEMVSDELREFFRIDAFLPIKYYISSEQKIEILHKQWELRRTNRQQLEFDRNDGSWNSGLMASDAVLPRERIQDVEVDDTANKEAPDAWDTIIPLAANISGGGLRLITHQDFKKGEYVLLEILVPTPRRIVDVIARVIFANHNYAAGTEYEYYNTGMQFVYIDERDRDAIVNHIANIQLKRIRLLREQYLFRGSYRGKDASNSPQIFNFRTILSWTAAILVVILIAASLTSYFWDYTHNRQKGEIEQIFEDAIKKYRDR